MTTREIQTLLDAANAWLTEEPIDNRTASLEAGHALQEQLKQAAEEDRKSVGPFLGKVISRCKLIASMENIDWTDVEGGKLAIGHRPAKKRLEALRMQGCTHILTLLSEREGSDDIRRGTIAAGIEWIWFEMENGDPPAPSRDEESKALFKKLSNALKKGARIYIHCSAGIHRTGMLTYGLLRYLGHNQEAADGLLHTLRQDTSEGVGEARKLWASRFIG